MTGARQHVEESAAAAAALADGRSVVLPTECGYVLVGGAGAATRLAAMAGRRSLRLDRFFGSAESLLGALGPGDGGAVRPIHSRLVSRLAPGPVVFVLESGSGGLRAPSEASASQILRRHESEGGGVVGVELMSGTDSSRPVRDADEAGRLVEGWGETVGARVDSGPSRFRDPATVVELRSGQPAFRVVRTGAYEARFVVKQAERTILFVCTGNTCRSPMAEAIANDLLRTSGRDSHGAPPIRVVSAGVGAERGRSATPEAVEALRTMGIPWSRHSSRPLTQRLVDEADAVFVMTRSHLRAIVQQDPGAAGKATLLDPSGGDVSDPIGQPASVYTQVATRLRDLIRARLEEMDA